MNAKQLYRKLNDLGWDWECRDEFEGLRVINIVVEEDEDDDISLAQYISDYILEELTRNGKHVTKLEGIYLEDVISNAIDAYEGGAR